MENLISKILIIPDSFKETLSAMQVANAMQRSVEEVMPNAIVEVLPFSDGGEGFTQTCFNLLGGVFYIHDVCDAVGDLVKVKCLVLENGTGVMEIAEASGLQRLDIEKRNPSLTSSYGSGQLLKFLMDKGCKEIWIGLGGSAVNDGGAGLLQALGVKLFSSEREIKNIPQELNEVTRLDFENIDARWNELKIVIASDVETILLGPNGATYTFAKQKGATLEMLPILEARMLHWVSLMEKSIGLNHSMDKGSGAAGGIGYALLHATNASRISGFDLLANACNLKEKIKKADLVLTGEGKFDATSLNGKLVGRILNLCSEDEKPVYVFCGKTEINDSNIFSISDGLSFEESKLRSEELLYTKVVEVLKTL